MTTPAEPRLTRPQYDELYTQFSRTPDPAEGFAGTGEHWQLMGLLNKWGFYPMSRQQAVRMAQDLLDAGWKPDEPDGDA